MKVNRATATIAKGKLGSYPKRDAVPDEAPLARRSKGSARCDTQSVMVVVLHVPFILVPFALLMMNY